MARARQSTVQSRREVPLLQKSLILTHFICRKLGVQDLNDLRDKLRGVREDWADDGHSYFFHTLKGEKGLEIAPDELALFDLRIKQYVSRLNSYRSPRVKLKYFQYLAALFSEIYLNRLFNDRQRFLNEIRGFAREEHGDLLHSYWSGEISSDDLTKIAFWMATGSGKTLIMHINLWQYNSL